jgi:integrase
MAPEIHLTVSQVVDPKSKSKLIDEAAMRRRSRSIVWHRPRGSLRHVTAPKGGKVRYVPLTRRLTEALREWRHLRGPRVLTDTQGHPLTQKTVQGAMSRAARKANVRPGVHILRHTFCSHLAMRGAPARSIQELAGHQDPTTTQRYMHLSPGALDAAIRLLEAGDEIPWRNDGGGGKTTLKSSIS